MSSYGERTKGSNLVWGDPLILEKSAWIRLCLKCKRFEYCILWINFIISRHKKIRKATTNHKSTFSWIFFKTALASFRQCDRWAFCNVRNLPIEVKYLTEKSKRSVPESQRIAKFKPLATVHHCLSWVSSISSYFPKIFPRCYQGRQERRRQPRWRGRAKPSCGRPTSPQPTGRSQARCRTWWRQSCP